MIPILPSPRWGLVPYDTILHHCHTFGAVLLRGRCNTVSEFEELGKAFSLEAYEYVGGAAPRKRLSTNVFTSNESPPTEPIPFHHELAQTRHPPRYIMFYCDVTPCAGGRTLLLRSDFCYDFVSSSLPRMFEKLEEGVLYTRTIPESTDETSPIGRSWRDTFLCSTRLEAEESMRKSGMTWEWLPNGDLRATTSLLPAFRDHVPSGRRTFHNSILAVSKGWKDARNDPKRCLSFSDGTPFSETDVRLLDEYATRHRIEFDWKKGDVLLVDNYLMMHARQPFPSSSKRRILASVWN